LRVAHEIQVEDEESATMFMVYHLKLAAAYFECTHTDNGVYANKIINANMPTTWKDAASSFVNVLCSTYEEAE
jgi:hypothetical protein